MKSLSWVILGLVTLTFIEDFLRNSTNWLKPLSATEKEFNIEQLRLYAQILTAIFSIYFATIGIILSSGYTRLRRDVIQMLVNEQVGSLYSQVLVLAAVFCLAATASPLLGLDPGLFIYVTGTVLTLLSALALFPLGQRLFNFFDLNLLVHSEILTKTFRHIKGAANNRKSVSLANHHSRAARKAIKQLSYIDERIKSDKEGLQHNLPALSDDYTALLIHYLQQKHTINPESYWFPRQLNHKQWFFAEDTATSIALKTSNQQLLIEKVPDHHWLENEIINRLVAHMELAFQMGDFELALKLLQRFATRISSYAQQFQLNLGMQELTKFREIIEQAAQKNESPSDDRIENIKIEITNTWAELGSNLCLETLRRIITFDKEFVQFLAADEWTEKSLQRLPAFLQVELAFIVDRIEFERKVDGKRLSKSKYVRQLATQKLLKHYSELLPAVCDFHVVTIPNFVSSLTEMKMSVAATQVALASLHNLWKLPSWFETLAQIVSRYHEYKHYLDENYKLTEINLVEMSARIASGRADTIATLGNSPMVMHIFDSAENRQLPDHFGQIYFELAEACIQALEKNDKNRLDKVLPMFMSLAFLASDSKFADPSLEISNEFRLHLISTAINDLASVLGFAILYGAYFDNKELSEGALAKFRSYLDSTTDKQLYFKRMIILSNTSGFSLRASPRESIRMNWRISFDQRARLDGFKDRTDFAEGKPHPNKIVREFLTSFSEASHLFFATEILPHIDPIDFDIDRQITNLARRLSKGGKEVQYEDH